MVKLTFETWRQWKADLESMFLSQGSLKTVNDPEQSRKAIDPDTWKQDDSKAKHLIITSLGDHWIAYDVKALHTSAEMWTYLVDFFEGKGIERKRRRWYAFQDVQLKPGQRGRDFAGLYQVALSEALAAGCQLDGESQVFDFIHRVGQQFPHFKLNQEMRIDAADKVPELQQLLKDFTDFTSEHDGEIEKSSS